MKLIRKLLIAVFIVASIFLILILLEYHTVMKGGSREVHPIATQSLKNN